MFIVVNPIAGPGGNDKVVEGLVAYRLLRVGFAEQLRRLCEISTLRERYVTEGFKHAIPAMKQFKGFLGLEIWTAQDGSMQAISRWTSKEALDEYVNHSLFQSHHRRASGEQMNTPGQVSYYTSEQIS